MRVESNGGFPWLDGAGAEARTVCTRVRANLHHPINRAKMALCHDSAKNKRIESTTILDLPLFFL